MQTVQRGVILILRDKRLAVRGFDGQHGGDVIRRNDAALTQDGQLFADIAQLPDVTRPGIMFGASDGLRGHQDAVLAEFSGVVAQIMLHEQRQVALAPAQGRQLDGQHFQAIVQVFTESALPYHLRQVAVGRADDAHVDGDHAVRADAAHLALLYHAQQAALQRQRDLAHLVQEDGALVRRFKQADLAGFAGACKGAALIAEQLAFHEVVGNGRAVDCHKGAVRAVAFIVDGLYKQFLAGARLAGQQYVAVHMREALGRMDGGADGRAFPQDVVKAVPGQVPPVVQAVTQPAFRVGDRLICLKGHQGAQPLPFMVHRRAVEHEIIAVDPHDLIGIGLAA